MPLLATDAGGNPLALSGFAVQGFPGQRRTLPDLYYNRYRAYDPTTGRYIQADPIGLAGGASPYSYAMNNPLRYTDPTGEFVPLAAEQSLRYVGYFGPVYGQAEVRMKMVFSIYENWTHKRACLHRAEFCFCRNGERTQTSSSRQNGRWLGPFSQREEAVTKMRGLDRVDTKLYGTCDP